MTPCIREKQELCHWMDVANWQSRWLVIGSFCGLKMLAHRHISTLLKSCKKPVLRATRQITKSRTFNDIVHLFQIIHLFYVVTSSFIFIFIAELQVIIWKVPHLFPPFTTQAHYKLWLYSHQSSRTAETIALGITLTQISNTWCNFMVNSKCIMNHK